jgi:hypothetical protein
MLNNDDNKDMHVNKAETPPKKSKDKTTTEKKKKKVSFAQQNSTTESEDESEPETQFLNFGFCITSSTPMKLRNMILLDNQSTVDLFSNRKLVSRVWGDRGLYDSPWNWWNPYHQHEGSRKELW